MPDNDQKLKVYLETSFVNYLTGRQTSNVKIASEQAYTRQWWKTEKTAVLSLSLAIPSMSLKTVGQSM